MLFHETTKKDKTEVKFLSAMTAAVCRQAEGGL